MDAGDWWRAWLGVPERSQWYVRHRRAGTSLDVEVGDGTTISCAVVGPLDDQSPVVVVPFYRVSYVTGRGDPARYGSADTAWQRAYATHLAERGVTAVVVPWWFESLAVEGADGLSARYARAVDEHRRRHTCTGLGRSVADLTAVLDALDREAIGSGVYGCFGHSLGGKLAMFLSALDERIAAAVLSEPGVGWAHSNWSAPWYVGDLAPAARDHDELLAAIPPRRLLLLAGGDSDGEHNAALVAEARRRAGDLADRIDTISHGEGHTPPWWALEDAYAWLRRNLTVSARP